MPSSVVMSDVAAVQDRASTLRRIAVDHAVTFEVLNEPAFLAAAHPDDLSRMRANSDLIAAALRKEGFRFLAGRWLPPVVPAD